MIHRPDPDRLSLREPGLAFAVFAPFGIDPVLSSYPDGEPKDVAEHPLVAHLRGVAAAGATVVALVDLHDAPTCLVELPAGRPDAMTVTAVGKLDMCDRASLSRLLARTAEVAPGLPVVLALEGHGAGFLPDLDAARLAALFPSDGTATAEPAPAFPARGAPVLPIPSPTSPTDHAAISTWGVGEALRGFVEAGGRVAVLHLDNCFNMSVELLHTVSPWAEVATGYCNYNFFTAGEAYPAVFERLAAHASATPDELGRWFAEENHRVLRENGHEPTVGGSVRLSRLRDIVEKVDDLSDALLAALRTASPAERPGVVDRIGAAIARAQQYDTRPGTDYRLDAPDELTDLDSLATELMKEDFGPFKVHAAADALRVALSGIKVYGDRGTPWMAPDTVWDFSARNLAMNIFLPDPQRRGLWDWRSQYYLDVNPDPSRPLVQPHVIDFVKVTDWVDFLVEYHRETPFVRLLPASRPEFPVKSRGGEAPPCMRHRRPRDGHAVA